LYKGGIDTVIFILGLQGDKIKAAVEATGITSFLNIKFVDAGADYSSGYARSLALAREHVDFSTVLLCNADHIFQAPVVYNMITQDLSSTVLGKLMVDNDVDQIEGVPSTAVMFNVAQDRPDVPVIATTLGNSDCIYCGLGLFNSEFFFGKIEKFMAERPYFTMKSVLEDMVSDGEKLRTTSVANHEWLSIETTIALRWSRKYKWVTEDLAMDSVPVNKVIPQVMAGAIKSGVLCEDNAIALFMDLDRLRQKVTSLFAAFEGCGAPRITHAYAVKANPLCGVMNEMCRLGTGAECASIGEVMHSINAGFDPKSVVFDSPCKTTKEVIKCFEMGVLVNLDCLEEVEKVARILDDMEATTPGTKAKVRCGIRINPQIGAGSIASTSTATASSKFGTGITDYHDELVQAYCNYEWLTGIHIHVGSQGCEMQLLVDGVAVQVGLAEEINAKVGRQQVSILDIGGGLPMNYWSEEEFPTYQMYAEALKNQIPSLFTGGYHIYTEMGRSLIQKAGWIGTRVEYCKVAGGKNIATVHCGSNMMLRTCYLPKQWPHDMTVLDHEGGIKTSDKEIYDIAGPLCFSGDLIAVDRPFPKITSGDHMVVHDCGGYTMGMYSKYNSRPAPAVYAYESKFPEKLILWKEAETLEQTLGFWGSFESK